MGTRTFSVELPDDLVEFLGAPEAAAARVKDVLVLDLLRQGRIGQSRAAELLGISRWDLLDLMSEHHIQMGPETAEDMAQEIADTQAWAARQGPRAGGQ